MKHEANELSGDEADAPDDFVQFVTQWFGAETMRQIEAAFGGRQVSLPSAPKEHHDLCRVIGVEKAQTIAIMFGHGRVNIPLGHANRRVRIEEACIAGKTATQIVREFGCCSRTVHKIRAKLRREGRM